MEEASGKEVNFIELASEIVAAYVSNNPVPHTELPALIASVHSAVLGAAAGGAAIPRNEIEKPTPAQVRKSITHDALISFIDGKPYKTLKRHLSANGLDPREYRRRYGLPDDYPMVAASYAEHRSQLAKDIGLGQHGSSAKRK
jgi:predicted transcriptional regulator